MNWNCILERVNQTESTNDDLMVRWRAGELIDPVSRLARHQTKGKGRAGRAWFANPQSSLCFSLAYPFTQNSQALHGLSLACGLAVLQGIATSLRVPKEQLHDLGIGLKWPNDLLIGSQKLGGVLCESFQTEAGGVTIVGLGLNIHPVNVPQALSGQGAASLVASMPGIAPPTARSLAGTLVPAILDSLDSALRQGISSIFSDFAQRDAWLAREVEVIEQGSVVMRGKAMGINHQGAYLVNTEHGIQAVNSGDLSLRAAP